MPLIDDLKRLLDKGRDDAMLRFGLGNAYFQQEDYREAVVHLNAAVAHDEKYSAAWKLLGRALAQQQNTDGAINAFQKGIEIAEEQGDKQAAREMRVFLKRLRKLKQDDDAQ